MTEYHNHYNPWYPLSVKHHSDEEILKLINPSHPQGSFGLKTTTTTPLDFKMLFCKTVNMESIGTEDHLIREMYNPDDQLVWWKTVCGKTIEFKMEL